MTRKELAAAIAVATGMGLAAVSVPAIAKPDHTPAAAAHTWPMGYARSGNPKAAGGPLNPGVGNPFNAY